MWDGNEVWLLAAGGTLYFAFPQLYASGFSGFYLPLMMVLWLLMLRAIGIEFRTHMHEQVWRGFFDTIFGVSSILLAIFFGAALGNVVRGVPLNPDGYFFEPLWTNWRVGAQNGILDWYTVMCGVIALVTLVVHGSLYLATKTEGAELPRAQSSVVLLAGAGAADHLQPDCHGLCPRHSHQLHAWPIGYLVPAVVIGSLLYMFFAHYRRNEKGAFLGSSSTLLGCWWERSSRSIPRCCRPAPARNMT